MNKPPKEEDFLVIEEFERKKFPVLICLFGHSGCGKTFSAIKIARGMGGKIAFLDTETGRGRVYADDAKGFLYAEFSPPFTPERYIAAFKKFESIGVDTLILDSGSHEWEGLGGMHDIADANVTKDGQPVLGKAKWSVKKRHKRFTNSMMAGRMNIIICLRAKDRFLTKIINGKSVEVMEGFLPIQERNFKYDMMIQLPMPEGGDGRYIMDKTMGFKCPQGLLAAFPPDAQIDETVGKKIAEWINLGKPRDELLLQLKNAAMDEAEEGVEHFRKWWKTLPREHQIMLDPFVKNFESIARAADLEGDDGETPKATDAKTAVNEAGCDISSLQDNPPVKLDRRPEDSDWWSMLDGLEPPLKECANMKAMSDFLADNQKSISSLEKAPEHIRQHWNDQIGSMITSITKKAA